MQDFEKLGAFYLGKRYDLGARRRREEMVLYDSRDMLTHGVVVGMTGSGKTGLCLTILEEAAIDGVPAILIDPKGDLTNLLLTFPQLRPADFAPWINEEDARRKGMDPQGYAAEEAERWKKGLAAWGQDGARIQRLRDAAEFVIYTPRSSAGLPVSIMRSFAPPPAAVASDPELMQQRVSSTATSILALLGITGDPLQSREHILLSNILSDAWGRGRDLDLAGLVAAIQNPPVTRLGVMDLETFYPAKERFGLAMQLNGLLASPGFSRWVEGEPLDIGTMLHTPAAKPRVAIFSIAHLSDAERMFFVALLLNNVLGWVRTQSGTSSLRALLYMDEIAGYFPPTSNPPSKGPLLMLMKQARAFGLGVLLATQNPVDLDYKGLANAGTWFIGRLQTQRDKDRLLDGLEGAASQASAGFDRAAADRMISELNNRVFLMNNVHDEGPQVIETRWALSYLRGPLTREQIGTLMSPYKAATPPSPAEPPRAGEPTTPEGSASPQPTSQPALEVAGSRPVLQPGISQCFVPARAAHADAKLVYRPMLFGSASVYYSDAKTGVDQKEEVAYLIPLADGQKGVDWDAAQESPLAESDLEDAPAEPAGFAPLPPDAGKPKSYEAWKKGFADLLYRTRSITLLRSPSLGVTSPPGVSEREFRVQLAQSSREARDEKVAALREKYASRMATLEDRLRRAQQAVEVQRSQARQSQLSTVMSVGSALLTAFLGKKAVSATSFGRAATAARGAGRAMKESGDIGRAEENVAAVQGQVAELQNELQTEIDALNRDDPSREELERVAVRPKKTNISVKSLLLAWAPYEQSGAGESPAWG